MVRDVRLLWRLRNVGLLWLLGYVLRLQWILRSFRLFWLLRHVLWLLRLFGLERRARPVRSVWIQRILRPIRAQWILRPKRYERVLREEWLLRNERPLRLHGARRHTWRFRIFRPVRAVRPIGVLRFFWHVLRLVRNVGHVWSIRFLRCVLWRFGL